MSGDVTLTDAERESLADAWRQVGRRTARWFEPAVERIVADRLAAERERIARAIEAERDRLLDRLPATHDTTGGWQVAINRAARIARGDA